MAIGSSRPGTVDGQTVGTARGTAIIHFDPIILARRSLMRYSSPYDCLSYSCQLFSLQISHQRSGQSRGPKMYFRSWRGWYAAPERGIAASVVRYLRTELLVQL